MRIRPGAPEEEVLNLLSLFFSHLGPAVAANLPEPPFCDAVPDVQGQEHGPHVQRAGDVRGDEAEHGRGGKGKGGRAAEGERGGREARGELKEWTRE